MLKEAIKVIFPKFFIEKLKIFLYPLIPLEKRVGNRYWKLKSFLDEAQWWDIDKIRAFQFAKLKEIIEYAYNNVPGYYFLYREKGVKPKDFNLLDDLKFIPATNKELFRDNLNDFTTKKIPKWQLNYVTTGGSTGIPFGFYHTKYNYMERVFMHKGWEMVGWRLGDMSAVLRGAFIGSNENYFKYDPISNELLLSSYYLNENTYKKYVELITLKKPSFLQAYPSAVTIFADLIKENKDIGKLKFKAMLLGSENLYEWQEARIKEAFPGTKLFCWYGHAEQVVLAPWCEKTNFYHCWPFYGFTEILNNFNEEVSNGDIGEIVGTSFWNYGTPFIRYKTMDFAEKKGIGCEKCGRNFLLLKKIEGRLQEFIITKTGRYISMTSINMHTPVFDNVKQFQFYQEKKGKVLLKIIPKKGFSTFDLFNIHKEISKKLGEDTELEVVQVNDISKTQTGKYRFLEQKLNIKYGE